MPKRTIEHRSALLEELQDPQNAASYINASLEDSEDMFLIALRDVAEAHQMSKVAEDAGVAREALYKMLSNIGNPRYTSLTGVLSALKLRLRVETIKQNPPSGGIPVSNACFVSTDSKDSDIKISDINFEAPPRKPVSV